MYGYKDLSGFQWKTAQDVKGRKIFYFFHFIRWYCNHYQIVVYPKVNYVHKFEDHICLKNVKFEFLKVILIIEYNNK